MDFATETNMKRRKDQVVKYERREIVSVIYCNGAGSAAPRSTKFCAVYDIYVPAYYSDMIANQRTPPPT